LAAVERAIAALQAGEPVLLPTDGVYGLCAAAADEGAVERLYALKGRDARQPSAVIAASVDVLLRLLPELPVRDVALVRAILPGAYTLVLANPARRLPWLNRARPQTIGVRVAVLPDAAQQVLDAIGAVAATSANEPGEPAAAGLDEVPARIRAAVGAELDAGRLAGTPSTVIDFTAPEPVVLREGAGPVEAALRAARRP
jgi:tRNA threonylcarbamoyl adenosine modification protein (Sua5/YciO/YrdC/YwlC family)